jgi:hypothetical protein
MKKTLSALLLFFIAPLLLFAAATPLLGETQELFGYVNASNYIEFTVDNSILPFDLMSPLAQPSGDPHTVNGIRIGTWTMVSNADSFQIDISHTPLQNSSSSVDYTLYFFFSANNRFVRNETGTHTLISVNNPVGFFTPGAIHKVQTQSVYLSLDRTIDELRSDAYATGNYSSTVTLTMTVEE